MQKNGKNKKQISKKIKKTQKQNKRGKKGKSKREKIGKKWTCPFAFILLFRFAFCFCVYFAFRCFFPGKKPQKKKANRKSKINAKKMRMDKSIFSPCLSLFDVPFFPIDFASGFFSFEVLLFDFPCVFLFLAFVQV